MPCKGFAVGEALYFPLINITAQWILFVNKINANDSNFLSKSFVLGADLDFANNAISPVGSNSNGFQGVLYGNKHSIKNYKVSLVNSTVINYTAKAAGLFYYLNGATIYDLNLASSCNFTVVGDGTSTASIGSIAAFAKNPTLINVNSNVNITYDNRAAATASVPYGVGGLIGWAYDSGISKFYGCSYKGTIETWSFKEGIKPTNDPNNTHRFGGLIGELSRTDTDINACYIGLTFKGHGGGFNGGAIGSSYSYANKNDTIKNSIVDFAATYYGYMSSSDVMPLYWRYSGAQGGTTVIDNVYLTIGASTILYDTSAAAGTAAYTGANKTFPASYRAGTVTNLVTNSANCKDSTSVVTNPKTTANSNATIKGFFNNITGTPTGKLNTTGNIAQRACC